MTNWRELGIEGKGVGVGEMEREWEWKREREREMKRKMEGDCQEGKKCKKRMVRQ